MSKASARKTAKFHISDILGFFHERVISLVDKKPKVSDGSTLKRTCPTDGFLGLMEFVSGEAIYNNPILNSFENDSIKA